MSESQMNDEEECNHGGFVQSFDQGDEDYNVKGLMDSSKKKTFSLKMSLVNEFTKRHF